MTTRSTTLGHLHVIELSPNGVRRAAASNPVEAQASTSGYLHRDAALAWDRGRTYDAAGRPGWSAPHN